MSMKYDKLFIKLKECGISSYKIKVDNIVSQSTLQKLREGKDVSTKSIGALCDVLNCQPGDIMEYIPDDNEK